MCGDCWQVLANSHHFLYKICWKITQLKKSESPVGSNEHLKNFLLKDGGVSYIAAVNQHITTLVNATTSRLHLASSSTYCAVREAHYLPMLRLKSQGSFEYLHQKSLQKSALLPPTEQCRPSLMRVSALRQCLNTTRQRAAMQKRMHFFATCSVMDTAWLGIWSNHTFKICARLLASSVLCHFLGQTVAPHANCRNCGQHWIPIP